MRESIALFMILFTFIGYSITTGCSNNTTDYDKFLDGTKKLEIIFPNKGNEVHYSFYRSKHSDNDTYILEVNGDVDAYYKYMHSVNGSITIGDIWGNFTLDFDEGQFIGARQHIYNCDRFNIKEQYVSFSL